MIHKPRAWVHLLLMGYFIIKKLIRGTVLSFSGYVLALIYDYQESSTSMILSDKTVLFF